MSEKPSEVKLSWNNSSLSSLLRCGEAFRRRYIEGEIIPPGVAMLRGTATHTTIKANMRRRMENAPGLLPAEARDLAAMEFDAAWRGGVSFTEEDQAEGIEAVRGQAKDMAVALSGLHAEQVAPRIKPLAVEEQILVTPRGTDILLHGTIDIQEDLGAGEGGIRDAKTKSKSPSKSEADESPQIDMYALLYRAKHGKAPKRIVLDHLVQTPARRELKWLPQETSRDDEDFQALVNRIHAATETVKHGIFLPASPADWWCSPIYCGYFSTCKFVRRTKRPTS